MNMAAIQEDNLRGLETYFEEMSTFLSSLEGDRISFTNERYTDYVLDRLSTCVNTLTQLLDHIESRVESTELDEGDLEAIHSYQQHLEELLHCVLVIESEWQAHFDLLQSDVGSRNESAFRLSTSYAYNGQNVPGRPKFNITKEQLEYLSSMSFSWSQIANILGVSRMTIYRRRVEFGLVTEPTTPISTCELILRVATMRREFPEMGETMLWCGVS